MYRFFGMWRTQAREPFADMDKSEEEFEQAVALAPNCFANKRIYAETYAFKKKERILFKRLLEEVVAGNPNALSDIAPENKYEQAIARYLLAQINEYFPQEEDAKP
jgi:hypothetical protein